MKLSIIRSDGVVVIDGVAYSKLDMSTIDEAIHAVQWNGDRGEVEFSETSEGEKPANQFIDNLDYFQGVIAAWQTAHDAAQAPPAPPTDNELIADCEQRAKQLLAETDWSQLPDVASALTNKSAFDSYRAAVRVYALAPVANPVWPDRPTAVWAS